MQSNATTVDEYLNGLPADRRAAIQALREAILPNLDAGYEEGIQYGHIGYFVPHRLFPAGYHCDPKQPLPFAAIASQKNHLSLYLMGVYCGCDGDGQELTPEARWFRDAWTKTGKKLDMGKACVRFKKIEDVPLDVVGEAIRRVPADAFISRYLSVIGPVKAVAPRVARASAKPAVRAKPAAVVKAKPAPKVTPKPKLASQSK